MHSLVEPNRRKAIPALVREKRTAFSGPFRFRIVSNSMHPMVEVGDWVVVEFADYDSVNVGDLLLYELQECLNCHRLVRKKVKMGQKQLITKGDRSLSYDMPWDASFLLGRVVAIERDETVTSLDSPKWRVVNLLLAFLSGSQAWIWRYFVMVKRTVLGSRTTGLSRILLKVLRLPSRLWLKIGLAHE